ncbi:MAG: ArsR/SmtB family transcription factor [Acidobacteriaceae bacterium]
MKKTSQGKEQFFMALADATRLRLLGLMGGREICVCYLVETLGQPQSKISRHLAYLRQAGIVSARRDGKWMHYRIEPQPGAHRSRILREALAWLREEKAVVADHARLEKACCAPGKNPALRAAPLPTVAKGRPRKRPGAQRDGK